MMIGELNLTEHRAYWLAAVEQSLGYWLRKDCATRHAISGRKMPENVYMWMVENGLVGLGYGDDCYALMLRDRGASVLRDYRREVDASGEAPIGRGSRRAEPSVDNGGQS